jgi:hypothetical protein
MAFVWMEAVAGIMLCDVPGIRVSLPTDEESNF